jgi:hypothetical protein
MRKHIFVLVLISLIASALVSGTLAMYTTKIDNLAAGSVVAKEFIFTSEGADSFNQGIKIAPSETVRWQFKVKNYKDQVITETDLYYKLTFRVAAATGKSAIAPLVVSVKDTAGKVLKSVSGVGTFDITGAFPLSPSGQDKTYVIEIDWPAAGPNNMRYTGSGHGSVLTVDAVASQVPLSGDDSGQPQQSDVSVKYETTYPWENAQSGKYQYNYRVTITNNSNQTIKDWNITFSLPTNRIISVFSNAKLTSTSPGGTYTFKSPGYNNPATDSIQPGQSVTFSGNATGRGTEAINNITVGGSNIGTTGNVQLICEFGKYF